MTDFATGLYHLATGLWWVAPIALGAWVAAVGLGRAAAREMPLPLSPVDAPDAAFEDWARRALGIANDRSYDRTIAQIRALPETGDR